MRKEKYFVGTEGEFPVRICFTLMDAVKREYEYIDSFDEDGAKHTAYAMGQSGKYRPVSGVKYDNPKEAL